MYVFCNCAMGNDLFRLLYTLEEIFLAYRSFVIVSRNIFKRNQLQKLNVPDIYYRVYF